MKLSKNGLDEMQKEKRNSIGNQMFMLMFYSILFECGLYGAGIRWLAYPADIMVIIMVCMVIYLVRSVASNAYLPPKVQNRNPFISLAIVILFSAALGTAAYFLFAHLPVSPVEKDVNDNSALILFIVSGTGLLIALVSTIIQRWNARKYSDD